MSTANRIGLCGKRVAGMTLVELMVALAIGSFLMIGAVTVFMQTRTTFRMNEAVSRLQENARFVIDVMEPDVRMANYFGLTSRSNKVQGRALPTQTQSTLIAAANDCGQNWSVNLDNEVQAWNNLLPAGGPTTWPWTCAPGPTAGTSDVQANTDALVIRRVTEDPVAPLANTLSVQSARFQDSQIFVGSAVPADYLPVTVPPTSQTHQLVVNGYYVSNNSSLDTPGNPVPSLRVKRLVAGPQVIDEEVLPGVEDMQIQLGIDTDVPGAAGRGTINRYVNPGDPLLNVVANPNVEVLAVRIWLRVRAERPDFGYTDASGYVYADRSILAPGFNDRFRRVVVSKTIYLRNARPPI
jgi:type IV pilus assembly protein PilW